MAVRIFWRRAPLLAALALAGCKTIAPDVTGSIGAPPAGALSSPAPEGADLDAWRARHLAHPDDRVAAIGFARALRARGETEQAAAVMEKIAIAFPKDRVVLSAYGKALLDAGALERARAVLDGADTPDAPDWSVVNARGVIADRLDDHLAAQALYRQALQLAPGEPSVLSNYGLSLLLTHDAAGAEKFLREAAQSPRADPRMARNLALARAYGGGPERAAHFSARTASLGPSEPAVSAPKASRMPRLHKAVRPPAATSEQKPDPLLRPSHDGDDKS